MNPFLSLTYFINIPTFKRKAFFDIFNFNSSVSGILWTTLSLYCIIYISSKFFFVFGCYILCYESPRFSRDFLWIFFLYFSSENERECMKFITKGFFWSLKDAFSTIFSQGYFYRFILKFQQDFLYKFLVTNKSVSFVYIHYAA